MKRGCIISIIVFLVFGQTSLLGQPNNGVTFPNGARAAVCLTYDDGLSSHVNTVAPMLDKYGFKGTFFVTVGAESVREEMEKWKGLPKNGHELANHTAYHPCRKSLPGMDWVVKYRDLDGYTLPQMLAEIQLSNSFLQALDGEKKHTFAYPCAHLTAGGESYKDSISQYALASRGVTGFDQGLVPPLEIDLDNVPSWAPSGVSGKELIAYVEKLIENQTLGTFCFHGVGAEHLQVSVEAHEALLKWLADNPGKIWVATFKEATAYLKAHKMKN